MFWDKWYFLLNLLWGVYCVDMLLLLPLVVSGELGAQKGLNSPGTVRDQGRKTLDNSPVATIARISDSTEV